jgi:hypothetical protein
MLSGNITKSIKGHNFEKPEAPMSMFFSPGFQIRSKMFILENNYCLSWWDEVYLYQVTKHFRVENFSQSNPRNAHCSHDFQDQNEIRNLCREFNKHNLYQFTNKLNLKFSLQRFIKFQWFINKNCSLTKLKNIWPVVSEKKIQKFLPIRNKNCQWWTCFC